MKAITTSLLFIFLLISCKEDTNPIKQLTFSNFQTSLKLDMKYKDIVATFGEPHRDIGSGIHIYVYELADTTVIWIGYTEGILYAKHQDSDRNILHTFFKKD